MHRRYAHVLRFFGEESPLAMLFFFGGEVDGGSI